MSANGSVPPVEPTTNKSPIELTKDVTVIFLSGVAIVLGLLLMTYLLMILLDKYCCCLPGWRAAGQQVEIDHGQVARKAGLWGLTRDERQAIMERLLVGKPYSPDLIASSIYNSRTTDEENPADTKVSSETCTTSIGKDDYKDDDPGSQEETKQEGDEEIMPSDSELDEANHDVVCAICLSEYVDGEMVLTGTSCNHLFHKSCAYEWLSKHDHCPYCRKEMMTPDEMKTTAEDVLGQDRVLEMRTWGPTQELMRNSFQQEHDEELGGNSTTRTAAVELTTQSQPTREQSA